MKTYQAIFFDWDGTAVQTRSSPAEEVALRMGRLLSKGVRLFVISGTTYENIDGGKLHTRFSMAQRKHLFAGLGRGAHNFAFDGEDVASSALPPETLLALHDTAYQIHRRLLERYNYPTDIVFDRPNYCKIDLLPRHSRGEHLYLTGNEMERLSAALKAAGLNEGVRGLIKLAQEEGQAHGLHVKPTSDAKFLEVGLTTKADNVDAMVTRILTPANIPPEACCFWGDEFLELGEGIWGSDAEMITPRTRPGDFFDVGEAPGKRPDAVIHLGGGVERFMAFLQSQG